ncbi:MAG: lipid II flippase MurJ, partial [Anaerolineales bacterium]|nr:lipid II flippase MurJ [Anaerolineales bacterium]
MTARGRFLARTALLIAVFFGLDKVVALLRTVIIARVFGVSALLDAFNAANNIPDLLFVLISGGSLAMAFIPVLSEYFGQHGRAE